MDERIFPNVIIAGTNKAGTTSLFRYLSDHPDVCPSSIKEVTFFSGIQGPLTAEGLDEYASYFDHCTTDSKIRLEASPNYLTGGRRVAELIHQCIPDARLIFILREPVSRLLSNFLRRTQRLHTRFRNMTAEDYVQALIDSAQGEDGGLVGEFRSVVYATLLAEYLQVFDKAQIKVMFFDDLATDTPGFVTSVCEFIGIDASHYDDYRFYVENKTRLYRSKKLQKLAFRANMRLEPWLNRLPAVRRGLRDFYNRINEAKTAKDRASQLRPASADRLQELFVEYNAELGALLARTYPDLRCPSWVPAGDTGGSTEYPEPEAVSHG